jgi:hypothetical protein
MPLRSGIGSRYGSSRISARETARGGEVTAPEEPEDRYDDEDSRDDAADR